MTERLAMFRQPQRTSTWWRSAPRTRPRGGTPRGRAGRRSRPGSRCETSASAVRRRHRIADPPALEDHDARAPLRRVVRREEAHHAASDDDEVARRLQPAGALRRRRSIPGAACRRAPPCRCPSATAAASRRGSRRRASRCPAACDGRATRRSRTSPPRRAEPQRRATDDEALLDDLPLHHRDRTPRDVWSWKPVSLPFVHVITHTSTCLSRHSCSKWRSGVPWRTSPRQVSGSAAIRVTSSRSSVRSRALMPRPPPRRRSAAARVALAHRDVHRFAERQRRGRDDGAIGAVHELVDADLAHHASMARSP